MIDAEAVFTRSGFVAWVYLIWRAGKICNAHYRRVRWALSGYKRAHRPRHG